ncbi:MAG: hypothetical protein LOD88_01715 [Novibacillus thermophilus]|jgi:hypothetical protein|uniref:Uncharacterized protein n=1 Tax=Novibacillus thermophilus TaxID=1471761 RepID=A0A1U9K8L7_9BACL|nr:hypothetical protein [Novibacillus thermophilus]AQS56382.1 hypothetical protein B0W44_12030 [Novibacillus thermophilus]
MKMGEHDMYSIPPWSVLYSERLPAKVAMRNEKRVTPVQHIPPTALALKQYQGDSNAARLKDGRYTLQQGQKIDRYA